MKINRINAIWITLVIEGLLLVIEFTVLPAIARAQTPSPTCIPTENGEGCPQSETPSPTPRPFCKEAHPRGSQATRALLKLLTTREPSGDNPTTCSPDLCTWASVFANTRNHAGGSAAMMSTLSREDAVAQCLSLTSQYPWQDEDDPQSGGPDKAYNCRDASMAFIACMRALGFEGGVFRIHLHCTGCYFPGKGHSINLYTRDNGYICPVDPQASQNEPPNTDYQRCCYPEAQDAARCAESLFCETKRFSFLCCKPSGNPDVYNPDECPKEKSYCQAIDGTYTCAPHPDLCIPPGQPELDKCEKMMQFCYDNSDKSLTQEQLCKACNRCAMCPGFWNCLGEL